jgi:ubiquitin-activating enzyme E1
VQVNQKLNERCREKGIYFVSADARGVVGQVFVDFGPQFSVIDVDGEQPIKGLIGSITNDKDGVVTVAEESRHGLTNDMVVTFGEIEGMTELNGQERNVKYLGPYTFSIGDTSGLSKFAHSGYFVQVKKPKIMDFISYSEALKRPEIVLTDYGKMERGIQLHMLNIALSSFRNAHGGAYPRADSKEDAEEVVKFAEEASALVDGNPAVDKDIIRQFARCSSAQLVSLASVIGGFAAQEALKACTGKFTPLNNTIYIDVGEVIPKTESLSEFAPLRSRYDDQIAVIGRSLHERICGIRTLLVGSGAIGCEILKNWALMGVATGSGSQILVTDMDNIEKSNLNRQFLFRSHDVGQLKSASAAKAVKAMNPHINIVAHANRVGPDTEDLYDDDFWESRDVICTALDNVPARLYCDQRCVYFNKPLLESGTLGAKGNTQVVVPKLTQNYGATRDPAEEGIPICTLKNFPNKIEHTIQWARDMFEGTFTQGPSDANGYLSKPDYLVQLAKQQSTQLETLNTIKKLLVEEKALTYDDCVTWARNVFELEFNHNIRQLLHNFPADSVTASGVLFWSGPKRAPEPIEFDINDELHLSFVQSAANLRAEVFGLQGTRDIQELKTVLGRIKVKRYHIDTNLKIASNDSELKEQKTELPSDFNQKIREIEGSLPVPSSIAGYRISPLEFEKDDDLNWHMDFVTACSNLRARNYRIKEENKHETKRIAGKIIPAIATTTALVSGLICLELYKLIQNLPIESYRCAFVNLALPFASLAEPLPPETKKTMMGDKEWKWSAWDAIIIDEGDITLQELLDLFTERFGLEINMLSFGTAMLFSFFAQGAKANQRKKMKVSEVVRELIKTDLKKGSKYLQLEAIASNAEGEDVEVPYIKFKYRK